MESPCRLYLNSWASQSILLQWDCIHVSYIYLIITWLILCILTDLQSYMISYKLIIQNVDYVITHLIILLFLHKLHTESSHYNKWICLITFTLSNVHKLVISYVFFFLILHVHVCNNFIMFICCVIVRMKKPSFLLVRVRQL